MPRLNRLKPQHAQNEVKGLLAPESMTQDQAIVEVKDVIASSHSLDMCYMCRAYSEENRPGYHPNEDRFYCEEHVRERDSEIIDMFVVGVLDGHDGSQAADKVAEKLSCIVFNKCFLEGMKVHDAHVAGFAEIEGELKRKPNFTAGCCANSCVVWGQYLWCANLGDCRALYIPLKSYDRGGSLGGEGVVGVNTGTVIGGSSASGGASSSSANNANNTGTSTSGGASGSSSSPPSIGPFETGTFCWMSRDLKATVPYEVDRIAQCGWRVKDGRVEGLEPTRTIGDFDVKDKLPQGVISIVPETRIIDMLKEARKLDPNTTSCQGLLVQGSDGVWDTVNGNDIFQILNSKQKSIRQLQRYLMTAGSQFDAENANAGVLERIAGDIVTMSLSKGSCDDCTCILTCVSIQQRQ